MSEPSLELERSLQLVRGYQERATSLSPSERQIASFAVSAQRTSERRRWGRRVGLAAGAVAAAVAVLFIAAPWRTVETKAPAVAQRVEPALRVGEQLTTGELPRALNFDGAQMVLAPASGLLVESMTSGASVRLSRGAVKSSVTPAAASGTKREWHVFAGPFDVRVVGTVFSVEWEPELARVRVAVQRGVVEVKGPGIAPPESVRKGQTFVATVASAESVESPSERGDGSSGPVPASAAAGEQPPAPQRARTSGKAADWQSLAASGKYAEAMGTAESEGLEKLARRLSAGELLRLADIARIAGRFDDAAMLLRRVRARAPGSPQAASAAFALATTAFDQQGDHAQAVRWFDTYLRESPGGPLAAAALGRKLEAQQRLRRGVEAGRTAGEYLKKYPEGGHRQFALQVLESQK